MKEDQEFEMLLDEIPHAISLNHQNLLHQHNHHQVHVNGGQGRVSDPTQNIYGMYEDDPSRHYKYMCVSPGSGVSLQSEGSCSSSSLFSGGLSFSDDGLRTPPFEDIKSQNPIRISHSLNGLWSEYKVPDSPIRKKYNERLIDELGLSRNFSKIHVGDEHRDSSTLRRFPIESNGFRFGNGSVVGTNHSNGEKYDNPRDFRLDYSNYAGIQSSVHRGFTAFSDKRSSPLSGFQPEHEVGNLLGFYNSSGQYEALFSQPAFCNGMRSFPLQQTKEHASNCYYYHRETQIPNMIPSVSRPFITDALFHSQLNGMVSNGVKGVSDSPSSPHLAYLNVPPNVEKLPHYSPPVFDRTRRIPENNCVPKPLHPVRSPCDVEAFNCEDSFIIQGKGLNYVFNKGCDRSMGHKKGSGNGIGVGNKREKTSQIDGRPQSGGMCLNDRNSSIYCPLLLRPKFNSLEEVQGYIYFIAKDQHGCRFLQRKFDEGNPQDVQIIFNEVIDHVIELMMNPFGNYLMQKLFDVCNEDQRTQIMLMVTEDPGELVRISLNTHGTRVVQKLIETLKTRQQISLVISALEPGFLDLIKDLNGNHVIQRCLQCLINEDNKFIFDAAAKFCVDIATHRHGCCVLQRCIAHSTGEHRDNLVAQISSNGVLLAQDDFGNYVIQYILELNIPSATATLVSQFEGNYVHLSTQKFSSNVVEKCLKVFGEASRSRIIRELLSTSGFEQLIQDPYANYVIQSALKVTKGPLHASLVEAIRPYAAVLRTSPYCKKIFLRNLLKK